MPALPAHRSSGRSNKSTIVENTSWFRGWPVTYAKLRTAFSIENVDENQFAPVGPKPTPKGRSLALKSAGTGFQLEKGMQQRKSEKERPAKAVNIDASAKACDINLVEQDAIRAHNTPSPKISE